MQLILTHENADFDAVASLVAAQRLFPEAAPLLPRHLNRNVEQFLALYRDALPLQRLEDWRRRRVDEVVLVDTQTLPGVRGMQRDAAVQVIDHHQPVEGREAWEMHVEPVGATTTLLVEELQRKGQKLSAVEASLLLLGIYEDTGSLTYGTTTARDARAAAWLLETGADLDVVRRFLDLPLSEAQQALYDRLQDETEWHYVEGQAIAVAAARAPDGFDDEISAVAHRMRDALNPDGLILLVDLDHHVQLVARSTSQSVDVGVVAQALGGGGHSRAAAAPVRASSLRDLSSENAPRAGEEAPLLDEVVAAVVALLPRAVRPMATVAEIMSRGVQTLPATASVAQAAEQMQRSGHEGYPVLDPRSGRVVGLLTRRAVDRAIRHELGDLRVEQIMKKGMITVGPSDSVERVQQLMIDEDWGQIPVVEEPGGALLGIVTRTDLLRLLGQVGEEQPEPDGRALLEAGLPPAIWRLVQVVSSVAAEMKMPIYFVGGLVRDLLLELPAVDVDMVVEGDAITLARELRRQYGGRVRSHERFGTAKWLTSPRVWRAIAPGASLAEVPETVDFVTARTEFYERPSALPEVERGSIKLDLHRRDFTINTLAIRLDGVYLGELLDFYGGVRDLEEGQIRVLHSLSFIDDPTRILRAVRLEQRLGFAIEPRTAELITGALPMLDRVTGERIKHELELALREAEPVPVMERLDALGVLARLQEGLSWEPEMARRFRRLDTLIAEEAWQDALAGESPASVYFALWVAPLAPVTRRGLMDRLKVRKSTRDEVEGVIELIEALESLPPDGPPSTVERIVRPYARWPRILLAARAALGEQPGGELLERYWREWRHVETALDGNDLRDRGLEPGPQYGRLLDRLLAARLDGEVTNEAEERALVERFIQSKG